jgi:hypothetical protein
VKPTARRPVDTIRRLEATNRRNRLSEGSASGIFSVTACAGREGVKPMKVKTNVKSGCKGLGFAEGCTCGQGSEIDPL